MADNSARLEALEEGQTELRAEVHNIPDRVVTALQSAQGTVVRLRRVVAELHELLERLGGVELSEVSQRIDAVSNTITSPSTPAVVGETFFQHPGKPFEYAVPSTFSMPKVNVIDAWRMWHGGSKRCGETGREKVRPFKCIPEEHLLAISKQVMRNWRIWKRVMDHLCNRLDELKMNGVYDWKGSDGNKSPLSPETMLYLPNIIPAAPQKQGRFKRTIVASNNKVGTVYKNMSKARNQ